MRILTNWKQVLTFRDKHEVEEVTVYMRPSRRLLEYLAREYPVLKKIYVKKRDIERLKHLAAPNTWEFLEAQELPARPVEVTPEQKRKMAELRGLGLSYRKISHEIGVAPDTVWKHLNGKVQYVRFANPAIWNLKQVRGVRKIRT